MTKEQERELETTSDRKGLNGVEGPVFRWHGMSPEDAHGTLWEGFSRDQKLG